MAVKNTTELINKGDQVLRYQVGTTSAFPVINSGQCGGIMAGDKLIIKSVAPEDPATFNIKPDANGLMPVLCIYPATDRLADPNGRGDPNGNQKYLPGNCYGNDAQPDVYRIDIGSVYLRFNCSVSVEGGDIDTTIPGATSVLLITYTWDRAWVMNRTGQRTLTDHPLGDYTLTYYGVTPGGAAPGRVTRPLGAQEVWSPESQLLSLDYGPIAAAPGTTTTQDWTCANGRNSAMPWGSFQYAYTRTAGARTALINRIRL